MKYLDCLFANSSVSPGNDNDFPSQIRNVVDSEFGLWSEVTFDNERFKDPPEDAEGGEKARARHLWREMRKGDFGGVINCNCAGAPVHNSRRHGDERFASRNRIAPIELVNSTRSTTLGGRGGFIVSQRTNAGGACPGMTTCWCTTR